MVEIVPGSHWVTEEGPFVKTLFTTDREQQIDISEGAICSFFIFYIGI